MTNFVLTILDFIVIAVCSGIMGYNFKNLRDDVKELKEKMKKEEPKAAVTMGSYHPVNEFSHTNQDGDVGLVEAKTPQRVAFDAEQALNREARGQ